MLDPHAWYTTLLALSFYKVSASADGKSSGSKRKGGRQSRLSAEKAAKRRRMVGGVLKTVGTAAPGQQCTQCGTQVLPIPSCLLLQPLAAQSLLPFHTLHDVARRVWPSADNCCKSVSLDHFMPSKPAFITECRYL